jgi:hypothetical protein
VGVVPAILSDSVSDVDAAARKALADDAVVLSAARLVGDATSLFESRQVLLAKLIRMLRDAWSSGAIAEICGQPMKAWLVNDQYLSPADANRAILCAHHLHLFPAVESAFEAVRLGLDHAAIIIRRLLRAPDAWRADLEPLMVDFAFDHSPRELAAWADELLDSLDVANPADHKREMHYAKRGIDLSQTLPDTWVVSGTLTGDVGAAFAEALRIASEKAGPEDDRTPRQRRHDGVGELARGFLADRGVQPSFTGTPVGVIVRIPLELLEGRVTREAAQLLPSGMTVGPDTARRLACDAQLIPAVLGTKGEVLDIGRTGRDFTPAIRKAAYEEQGGRCAFPRCNRRVVECHHIVWWSLGGGTHLDHAAWLCAFHHWLVHEGRWTLRRDVDRSFLFTSPHGEQRRRQLGAA